MPLLKARSRSVAPAPKPLSEPPADNCRENNKYRYEIERLG
jgi:hypothetical protein